MFQNRIEEDRLNTNEYAYTIQLKFTRGRHYSFPLLSWLKPVLTRPILRRTSDSELPRYGSLSRGRQKVSTTSTGLPETRTDGGKQTDIERKYNVCRSFRSFNWSR